MFTKTVVHYGCQMGYRRVVTLFSWDGECLLELAKEIERHSAIPVAEIISVNSVEM